ncbi:hypothetical protein M431DRAFT_170688 [Trichoderma harzianum CBS 226.95]|uniref:Uncharacterized protein n=1 Tax=Trichoderma harzianum CBS 226.95 TaxID=983964 RepID=A0A2T4ASH0_TRIHA|nr:hypothetical protein M431DRAFT_170688 [Trichoderma harzianum CBS 226.95]PTB60012.1 hypothetical protein M431DRAFT_170688 [Trichoderma harzianum CBS 226.95]
MAKRKSDAEAPLARKKAKLQQPPVHDAIHIHNGQIPDIHALQSPYSPPLSMASPERREKRRRTPESDSQSDDTLEQPVAKRARTSQSPESPDASSEPWPSIEYNPCEEEPNWMEQLYVRSHMEAMLFHEEYDSDTSAHHQDALPSPEPSDQDLTESDEWEFPTVDSIKAPQSTPKTCRLLSRQRRRQQRNATPPPPPPPPPLQRKHRQPPPKMDKDGKRNKRNKEALSPAVEAFLHSKRSSRRDTNCTLWQLGDDGTACTVSRVR